MPLSLPDRPEAIDLAFVDALVRARHPGTTVDDCRILDIHELGEDNVSTSARVSLELRYGGAGASTLPARVIAKMSMAGEDATEDVWCARLYAYYENEVQFYQKLRDDLDIETPLAVGGHYDATERRYMLLLEDVTTKSVHFSAMTDDTSVKDVEGVLEVLAKVHARFWNSARLKSDLAWIPSHVDGPLEEFRRLHVYNGIRQEVGRYKFKRELLEGLGTSAEELFGYVRLVKDFNHANMPHMLMHGDPHLGNTYLTANGAGGLYDWQCFSRGYGIHDVTYHINTALSVELRRKHEHELLAFYRDRLAAFGVASPPDMDSLWLAHRRQALVAFFPGWFCTPPVNYGWDVLMTGLLRLSTAVSDLESVKAVSALR
ncbi:MAG: hypothetical protein JWR80_7625 [Bradyrhizobium sp.]|nr:hypothetical protein [Bradyrhizobium sp.]